MAALKWLARNPGVATVNLGLGRGYSVLEVIEVFERLAIAAGVMVQRGPCAVQPGIVGMRGDLRRQELQAAGFVPLLGHGQSLGDHGRIGFGLRLRCGR